MNIAGVGRDAPTVTNEHGGSQARQLYRFDLVDAPAIFAMCAVLHEGAEKYGQDNWRNIGTQHHINHALIHAYAWLAGDTTDDHLSNLMCRSMFAKAMDLNGRS